MLLGTLGLLFSDPGAFFAMLPAILLTTGLALVVGITIHEFSHALAAHSLGDDTAKGLGRLSLNPLAHLDPLGTAMLLLVGFGWGRPVPVDHRFLRNGRRDMALVAAAGPLSNVATAFLAAIPFKIGLVSWHNPLYFSSILYSNPTTIAALVLEFIILYNVILAVFNLIPLFPLDGSKVALGLLPKNLAPRFARLEVYGPAILVLVIGIDFFTRANILWRVMGPAVNLFTSFISGRTFF